MRGLKLESPVNFQTGSIVARFPRAWIETRPLEELVSRADVARFPRAWIETPEAQRWSEAEQVARFPRAWIETLDKNFDRLRTKSHASRVRGLKLESTVSLILSDWSHASRVRGLKRFLFVSLSASTSSRTLPACVD